MAREIKRLSPRGVAAIDKPGRHADGDGLYLIVDRGGAKRWAFLFRWKDRPDQAGTGRLREMGLGSLNSVSLARAREKAAAARVKLDAKIDPIKDARAETAIPTFGAVADELVADLSAQWRNEKHRAQWKNDPYGICRADPRAEG